MFNNSMYCQCQNPVALAIPRRAFMAGLACGASTYVISCPSAPIRAGEAKGTVLVTASQPSEDLFGYIQRRKGAFDRTLYRQLLGASNEFKEGDDFLGVAAADAASRENARVLLARTRIGNLGVHSVFSDAVSQYIDQAVDATVASQITDWSIGDVARFLLESSEDRIKRITPGLTSDVIAGARTFVMARPRLTATKSILR